MADVYDVNPNTSNAGVATPRIAGNYFPAIDQRVLDGWGLSAMWGGGQMERLFLDNSAEAGSGLAPRDDLGVLLMTLVASLSGGVGSTVNYNFEGLLGPAGPPGPPGPRGYTSLVEVPLGIASVPVSHYIDDEATPAAPTGLTATALIQSVMLEWTANSETDISHYEVWRHTADVSGSASKILETKATFVIDGDRAGGTPYYYWIKAVDFPGNTSGFSTGANATPTNVESADIVSIDASKVLISGAVYLSNWRHTTDVTKIDGGDIYTNSITATQINANTITASEIAAGTITYDELKQTGGSEAVNTGCIRDEATMIHESTSTSGATAPATCPGQTTLASLTITSVGGLVQISMQATIELWGGGPPYTINFYIIRGSTQLATWQESLSAETTYQYSWTDIPGSGSVTYHFKMCEVTAGSCKYDERAMVVQEARGK